MTGSGWNMYVFRDGRRRITGAELVSNLQNALVHWRDAQEHEKQELALAALIAAGELECALLDSSNSSSHTASEITEAVAFAFLTGKQDSLSSILYETAQVTASGAYEVAVQEGFAYYALHPMKIKMLLDGLALAGNAAVIGIRSIGVTLSAVACATLRLRGIECPRINVRPTGHPYNRKLEVTSALRDWIEHSQADEFLIVDEGPGISGSSFLSVAEALVEYGIDAHRVHMIGSRSVHPSSLRAENAAERWTRFHFHVLQNAPLPPSGTGESLSGGTWRQRFRFEHEDRTPAAWASLEPAKFLACDQQSIFRFEGFGHFGAEIGARAQVLASHGFAPQYLGNYCGFGQYKIVHGRMLTLSDWLPEMMERVADYLALRSSAFATNHEQTPELEKMLRWDWNLEFGAELDQAESHLVPQHVVFCDGRMMPHEWLCTESGEVLKLDGGSHGDDHFFPGPCDIAWDVAGVIVEWDLEGEVCRKFVREYEARSGDPVSQRLSPYMLAYTIFRLGWSKMASLAMAGEYDEALLKRDYERYRAVALRLRPVPVSGETHELTETEKAEPSLGSAKIA